MTHTEAAEEIRVLIVRNISQEQIVVPAEALQTLLCAYQAAADLLRLACEVHTCDNCKHQGTEKCAGGVCLESRYYWKWRGPAPGREKE